MCNTEYATLNDIPKIAVCSCGASFFRCDDDLRDAWNHITPRSSPNHRWVFICEDLPDPERFNIILGDS